jgi:hypothetical protein
MQAADCAANAVAGRPIAKKQLEPNAHTPIRRLKVITVIRTYYEKNPPDIPLITTHSMLRESFMIRIRALVHNLSLALCQSLIWREISSHLQAVSPLNALDDLVNSSFF